MKVKCEIWYPYFITNRAEIEVEIPENEDAAPTTWKSTQETFSSPRGASLPDNEISTCLELNYAGVEKI